MAFCPYCEWTDTGVPAMLRLSENLRSVTNADGGVILDLCRGQIFRCNATGAIILELLARGLDQPQLVSEFSRLCKVPQACASDDVRDFLTTLSRLGLLQGQTSHPDPERSYAGRRCTSTRMP